MVQELKVSDMTEEQVAACNLIVKAEGKPVFFYKDDQNYIMETANGADPWKWLSGAKQWIQMRN